MNADLTLRELEQPQRIGGDLFLHGDMLLKARCGDSIGILNRWVTSLKSLLLKVIRASASPLMAVGRFD